MRNSLKKLNKQIVEALKPLEPEKILLFGSLAWGRPKEDSDVDLLIIKNTKKPIYKRIPEARLRLFKIDHPFDILVMTPKEIERKIKLKDFFIKEILSKGKILYEAKK